MAKRTERQSMTNDESRAIERETRNAAAERGAEPRIDHEQIAARAHDLYVARGRDDGHDLEDWLEAERELRERHERSE